jgi:branched-chain amino acid transport system permease protein
MAFCGLLNASIERVAYRPLRNAPRLAPLITAIGMSFILQDVGLNRLGPAPVSLPNILPTGTAFTIGGNNYGWDHLIVGVSAIPVLALLVWLVQQTRQGRAMRATAQDQEAAAMMGINVNGTIWFTFMIAGALAGVAGLLYALYSTNIQFDQGFTLGLIAFTAAVLGGIGNIYGAMLGGVVLGIAEALAIKYIQDIPGMDQLGGGAWKDVWAFTLLIVVLLVRPQGLLGERVADRA